MRQDRKRLEAFVSRWGARLALLVVPLALAACAASPPAPTLTPTLAFPMLTARPSPTRPSAWTATPKPTATSAATRTPTGSAPAQASPSTTHLASFATPWDPYQSQRNGISLLYPSSQEVMEGPGVVQLGPGRIVLDEGSVYIGVTLIHFFPYDASYLPPAFVQDDPETSVQAMVDFHFQGWEEQITEMTEPERNTVDGYPAAMLRVRRHTLADKRTRMPVDITYYLAAILREDRLIRIEISTRNQTDADLLPVYVEKLLQSVQFE